MPCMELFDKQPEDYRKEILEEDSLIVTLEAGSVMSWQKYIKNKSLVRFDYITFKSKYYKENGGLQTIRTPEYVYNSIYQIQSMFPQYCKMYIRQSTGNAELRLKDMR